jgi:dynein heavy chain|tara:strand:- start:1539 stop:2573 length:1035 start_codon:yes stop_codon:yes gene_type:complete
MISETEVSLEEHKEGFRDKLNRMVDTLIRDVDEFYAVFVATAPKNVTGAVTHANLTLALKSLSDFNGTVQKLTDRERELKKGLDIFNLPSLKLTPLGVVEMEIGGLTAVWELVKTWLGEYDVWSLGKFRDLRVEEMENTATQINKNVVKLGKKINGDDNNNEWVTWRSLKHTIDGFKKTMPLITDLRNPAIRERHWALVMEKCGVQFDPHGDDFTLGRVTDLALHTIDVFISELSGNATKELAIELALVAIKETWTGLKMDMVPFKDDRPDVFKVSAFPTHHVPPLRLRILVPEGSITSAHTRLPDCLRNTHHDRLTRIFLNPSYAARKTRTSRLRITSSPCPP